MADPKDIPGTPLPTTNNDSAAANLRELIKDCIAFDRSAQEKFYQQYAPAVYNAIRQYIKQDQLAQEVLNDSFCKIFTKLDQYNWQGPIEAWMRRIAMNTLLDHQRKYAKQGQINSDQVSEKDAWIDSDIVSNISFKELVACTHKLPDSHRTVFNLYVFEDMSHKEISKNLDIPEGTSRWLLNGARKILKELIVRSMK